MGHPAKLYNGMSYQPGGTIVGFDVFLNRAQEHLCDSDVDGWLLYDYRGMNPIFRDAIGEIENITRPCWLWIPVTGEPRLLVSYVDQGRFAHLGISSTLFVSRCDMISKLDVVLAGARCVAMEYSVNATLPRVSKVDGGTLELVRGLGVEVVSSADTIQFATQRWTDQHFDSHLIAAHKLSEIVKEAFDYIGDQISSGPTEFEVAEFIRGRFREGGLEVTDGPVVASNRHASDPHFEPTLKNSVPIVDGDWVLIDLWSRVAGMDSMFADITWTGYVGNDIPSENQTVFDAVIGGRDAALAAIQSAFMDRRVIRGWEVDDVARNFIRDAGFGDYFNHRLGHSLGREVHSNAVNLDGWETLDTRPVIPGIAVTIEPGIYLPNFGVRSEIDVFMTLDGPLVTTEVQREIVKIL